jgi:hypothetical protein
MRKIIRARVEIKTMLKACKVGTLPDEKWPSGAVTISSRKKIKIVEVKHPIFLQCKMLTSIDMWKQIFNDASVGIFPKHFSYDDFILTYKFGSKIDQKKLSQNPSECCYEFTDFLKSWGIVSEEERDQQRKTDAINTKPLEKLVWGKIRVRSVRGELVSRYVKFRSVYWGLSDDESKRFRYAISNGFILGHIIPGDVICDEYSIVDITSVIFNPGNRTWNYRRPAATKSITKATKSPACPKGTYLYAWNKIIDKLTGKTSKIIDDDESDGDDVSTSRLESVSRTMCSGYTSSRQL